MHQLLSLDRVRTPALQQLHRDWENRRRGREFPARADFDPLDLKYILGHLSLIDVLHDPLRFRYRLHASKIAERICFDMTGKSVDLIPDAVFRKIVKDQFAEVVESRAPVLSQRHNHTTDRRVLNDEALVLPLAKDGTNIDMLLVGYCWD
jgi:hypothetical protein